MMVELNNDAVDNILQSVLMQDYRMLCSDIDKLESAKELAEYQKQDLKDHLRYRNALETILEYYVGMQWKDRQ